MPDPLQQTAQQILQTLTSIPFEQCQPIDRNFAGIPSRPGLYAIQHRTQGLLYKGDRVFPNLNLQANLAQIASRSGKMSARALRESS